jgi:hypothetical protein
MAIDEDIYAVEEVGGRVTSNARVFVDDRVSVTLESLKIKQRELEKEKAALIEEGEIDSETHALNMWLCEAHLWDTIHKLERLKQRLKEKRTPNQTKIEELLQQRNIWRLNFNDRWALYR